MKKRKNFGKKIKRSKNNIYRKKKTKGQKVLGTVILIIIIAAIGFVGYCLGKPLLEYLGERGEEETPSWTPASSYGEQTPPAEETLPNETAVPDSEDPPATGGYDEPPAIPHELVAYNAPSGALANKAALSATLVKAKSSGYTSVAVQLKDESGYFHYASEMESLSAGGLIKGDMTASEIVETFLENNMIPTARLSVLKDCTGPKVFNSMSYKCSDNSGASWLDYSMDPPVFWIDPSADTSREYITSIVEELKNAGFMNIILENVVFPDFQQYDNRFILPGYFDKSRYKYLYNVIPDGTVVEMRASDILADEYGRTAEPLYDTSQLKLCKVAVVIGRNDFPVSEGNPADAASLVENVMSAVSKKTGGLTLIPVIDSDFAGSDSVTAAEALKKLGYTDYMSR